MQETLQKLFRLLPGYKGYEAMEHRRDADKILRTQLAGQFREQQETLTRLSQRLVTGGGLRYMDRVDRVSKGLDRFIIKLETAPRGYAGWFEAMKIDVNDLDQLYQFDLHLAERVPLLEEQLTHLETQIAEQGDVDEAITALHGFVDDLNKQLNAREQYTSEGKRPEAPPIA